MVKLPIRDLHSDKEIPPRVFDVVYHKNQILLEIKINKNKSTRVHWEDVVYQIEIVKQKLNNK